MFDHFLRDLLDAVPDARGAIFCDPEGETVTAIGASGRIDHSQVNDYDLRITGAQFATPIYLAHRAPHLYMGELREWTIAGGDEVFLVHLLPQGYYVVLCAGRSALRSLGMHELRRTAARIAAEM